MAAVVTPDLPAPERWYRRHAGLLRVTHWVNVICFTLLLISGLQIFNAHPALYVGERSDFGHPTLSILARQSERGIVGETVILGHSFDTSGVLGASSEDGRISPRAFPSWITIPSYQDLATGRRWHFFFAWLLVLNALVYLVWGIASRQFGRDLLPSCVELSHIGKEVLEHLHLRFPRGEAARRYNVLQQLAYLLAVFVLFPLVILAGLAMSPGIDSAAAASHALRGAPDRPADPFRRRIGPRALRHRASRDGPCLRRLEQSALDDHRLVRSRQSEDDRCSVIVCIAAAC
jgi:thiosulfate reductase cytochrome b subunit